MISFIWMKIRSYKSTLPVIIIMTCMTLVFVYVFGIGFSKGYTPKVVLIDEDQTQTSQMIAERLSKNSKYSFISKSYSEGLASVEKDEAIAAVHLEKGFEKGLELNKANVILYKGKPSIELMLLENSLNTMVSEVLMNKDFVIQLTDLLAVKDPSATRADMYSALTANSSNLTYASQSAFYNKDQGVEFNTLKSTFVGFLLFFSLFTIMFGIGTIVDEKELRVWHRQLVSPLTKKTIITGNLVSNFVLGMFQLMVIVIVSKYLFDMDWGGSTLALICVLGAYVLAGTAMGLFITGFVKTQQQLAAILPTVIVATSMIGGCMWPVEFMQSKLLRGIAEILPQRWGMKGLSQVILYNGGMADVVKPIIIMLIIAGVFLLASMITNKKSVV